MNRIRRFFSGAWQPFTLGGAARFATDRFRRLLRLQLVAAVVCALGLVLVLIRCWIPVVPQAAAALPGPLTLADGRLSLPVQEPRILGETAWFALVADPEWTGSRGQLADLQLELGATGVRVRSLLGTADFPWDSRLFLRITPEDAPAWWQSRRLLVHACLGAGFGLLLLGSWWGLACLYALPAWFLCYLLDRPVSLPGAWRMCGAALMPGATFLMACLCLYGLRWIPLLALLLAFALHVFIGWIYVLGAPFMVPRTEQPETGGNPFNSTDAPAAKS